jgi:hypothetical protein
MFAVNNLLEAPPATLKRCVDAARDGTLPASETGGTARLARELVRAELAAPAPSFISSPLSQLAMAVIAWGHKVSAAADEPPSARLAVELGRAALGNPTVSDRGNPTVSDSGNPTVSDRGNPTVSDSGTSRLARAVIRLMRDPTDSVSDAFPGAAQLAIELRSVREW